MPAVLQLTRQLDVRPNIPELPGIRLRHFESEADIDAWLSLRQKAFARERHGIRSWDRRDFQAEFLDKPWWNPHRMWLAAVQGSSPGLSSRVDLLPAEPQPLAGSVTLALRTTPHEVRPVVHWLAVAPRWRRRGIARLLIAALEQACWDAGFRQVWLETHEQWRAATDCYRALGYSLVTAEASEAKPAGDSRAGS